MKEIEKEVEKDIDKIKDEVEEEEDDVIDWGDYEIDGKEPVNDLKDMFEGRVIYSMDTPPGYEQEHNAKSGLVTFGIVTGMLLF